MPAADARGLKFRLGLDDMYAGRTIDAFEFVERMRQKLRSSTGVGVITSGLPQAQQRLHHIVPIHDDVISNDSRPVRQHDNRVPPGGAACDQEGESRVGGERAARKQYDDQRGKHAESGC